MPHLGPQLVMLEINAQCNMLSALQPVTDCLPSLVKVKYTLRCGQGVRVGRQAADTLCPCMRLCTTGYVCACACVCQSVGVGKGRRAWLFSIPAMKSSSLRSV